MARQFPSRPSLEQLKHQAKDLLKAHRQGDRSACDTLRMLRRFSVASDDEILAADLALNEVQQALALSYGFKSWRAMKTAITMSLTDKEEASMATIMLCGKSYRGSSVCVTIDGKPVEIELQ